MQPEISEYPFRLPPGTRDDVESYGPGDLERAYRARIADKPFARSLTELYRLNRQRLPAEVATIKGRPYIISHALGVIATEKPKRVQRAGFEVEILNGDAFILELFPNSSFDSSMSGQFLGKFETGLSVEGHAKATTKNLVDIAPISLGAGAEIRLSADTSLVGNVHLKIGIDTPFIQSIGQASSRATWQLDRHEKALVGDQALLQTIIARDGIDRLTCRISAYIVVDRWLRVPLRLDTETITAQIELS
jgi:hypothetical protein